MQVKLLNPQYSYLGGGKVSFSVTFQFIDPTTGTVLYESTASSTKNVNNPQWLTFMQQEIDTRIRDAATNYKNIMSVVTGAFPNATSPQDVLTQFATQLETSLNSGGGL